MNLEQNEILQKFYTDLEASRIICPECIEQLRKDTTILFLSMDSANLENYTSLHIRCLINLISVMRGASTIFSQIFRI